MFSVKKIFAKVLLFTMDKVLLADNFIFYSSSFSFWEKDGR
ncbi:MAG: hypothetical protein ACI85O_003460 [Saprospiraceae bacterium]